MPNYKYVAKALDGKKQRNVLHAEDEQHLAARLYEKQLFLLQCKETKADETGTKLKALEISDFSRQIGTMLTSGVSLTRAVDIILHRDLSPKVHNVYASLYRSLQQGITISDAMREQDSAFPELFINMYYAGESSGKLDRTALKMAEHYEKEHRLANKVKSAMTYPLILLCLTVVIMIGVFTLVLPSFFKLFEGMVLPLPTRIVMAISQGLTQNWLYLLIGVLMAVGVFSLLLKNDHFSIALHRFKLRLPKIGKLLKIIYTARFARTISSLYASGLSMMNALEIARGTIGNRYISDQFDKVIHLVRNGTPLSQAIAGVDGFDSKLASTILIGEETGKLDDMLTAVADSFDYEAEMATQRLTTFIEPILIIMMALIIGTIMISVMMPIYQLYQNIG